jgi:diguanylate cyclase (GGDEF)-like protein
MGAGGEHPVNVPGAGVARILVVDNEPVVRATLRRLLTAEGHAVECVESAEAALERLALGGIDVVLVDLQLGTHEGDGLDLLRAIGQRRRRPATVAVTGLADPGVAGEVFAAGAGGYVTKPFKPCDVAIAVQQAIRRLADDAELAERHRRREEELRTRADRDALTGLFNRRRFEEELERHLHLCSLTHADGALLLCDLDHFKLINDTMGHGAGDAVLRRVGSALTARLRSTDIVARLGGDEFAALLPGTSEQDAVEIARDLQAAVSQQPGAGPEVGMSIGVAAFGGDDGLVGDDLLAAADAALYEAKNSGRGNVGTWLRAKPSSRTWIERIRRALDDDGLVIHSQPIVALKTGQVVREELLVRMRGEAGELIAPDAFLPTAERFDFIQDIDVRVLETGLALSREGRAVNVNVSASTMQDDRIVETIERGARTGADPTLITIEITETSAASNMDLVCQLAGRLAELGCGLALDDFGTGFGTFTYLKHLPISCIKIDRDFVKNLAGDHADQRMIKAIVEIARAAGQITVAEGVEDVVSLDLLRRYGVDCAQGYYLARPALVVAEAPSLTGGAANLYGALARRVAA